MPKLTRNGDELELSLSGAPNFDTALSVAKSFSGRRFDGDRKVWCYPADAGIAERILLTLKPQADAALLQWVRNSRAEREQALTTPLPDDAELFVPWREKLRPSQRAAVEFLAKHKRGLLADEMGLGKANATVTPVLTPTGWTTMGELSVGDHVIGADGKSTRVEGIYPQGVKPLYRVTMKDGASTLVTDEHLWAVRGPNDRFRGGSWRVMQTKDLLPLRDAAGNRRWEVPLVHPVEFDCPGKLPISPYFLGVLLGDGSFRGNGGPSLSCHVNDSEIVEACQKLTDDDIRPRKDKLTYGVCGGRTKQALVELGLWGHLSSEKFIPETYLRAPVADRLALLQGLMDTDGYNQGTGPSAEIAVSCSRLADGIQELVRSLGGTAYRRIKPTTHLDSHRITVKLPPQFCPFQLGRKIAAYGTRSKYPLIQPIESIEYECDGEAVCIQVAAEDHLYVTEDYIVTHNTVEALSAVTEAVIIHDLDPEAPRLVVAPNSAKGVWAREIGKWLGKDEPLQIVDAPTASARTKQIEEAIAANAWCIVNFEQIRAKKTSKPRTVHHRDGTVSETEDVTWTMKQPLFEQTKWLAVIADEAHRAKNHKAQTSRGLWRIDADLRYALTGTPISNHPGELWSILRWLYPEQYHELGKKHNGVAWAYWPFYDEYVEDYDTGYGRVVVGVKNPDALRFELRQRMVRRTKQEVLDLPPKVREYIPIRMSKKQRKLYESAEKDFWLSVVQAAKEDPKLAREVQEVAEGKRSLYELSNGASRTVRLRQISSSPALLGGEDDSPKLDAVVDNIMDNAHKPHVVFTEFVGTANLLVERLRKQGLTAEAFTGEVTATWERTAMEDGFQAGEIDVLVGTIPAMGESVTLTAADTVHFPERSWVQVKNEQAEDRLWRIGQDNKVTVLIYENEESVDVQKVRPTNAVKQAIVSAVIATNEVEETERELENA